MFSTFKRIKIVYYLGFTLFGIFKTFPFTHLHSYQIIFTSKHPQCDGNVNFHVIIELLLITAVNLDPIVNYQSQNYLLIIKLEQIDFHWNGNSYTQFSNN